jgi:hypothetical protein
VISCSLTWYQRKGLEFEPYLHHSPFISIKDSTFIFFKIPTRKKKLRNRERKGGSLQLQMGKDGGRGGAMGMQIATKFSEINIFNNLYLLS